MRNFAPAFGLCALLATPGLANDGYGGLSATGLTFGKTDAVAMVEEDLFISPDKVTVDYLFRNLTDADVTGEMIFPLPPISIWASYESPMNLPEDIHRENLVGFTATVDGKDVPVSVDRIAVIEGFRDENFKSSMSYENPGRDITADLTRLGIPLTLDMQSLQTALLALSPAQQAEAAELGLAEFNAAEPEQGIDASAWPYWSIVIRYHWTQTFPAGADLKVSHEYQNLPPGGLLYWPRETEEWQAYLIDAYCIDPGTSAAIHKALERENPDEQGLGSAIFMSYVLRTANSWAGPIGKFRLTVDKGAPGNVLSLCAEGVQKTGPTTFVIEKENYTPPKDLEILVVQPYSE